VISTFEYEHSNSRIAALIVMGNISIRFKYLLSSKLFINFDEFASELARYLVIS